MSQHRRGQTGFTLLEVLVAMGLASLVLVPFLAWATASLHHQGDTNRRNQETAGQALLTSYFQRDVSTAAYAKSELQSGGAGANCAGVTGEDVHLALLSGDQDPRRIVYSSVDDPDPAARTGAKVLRRHVCREDLSATTSLDLVSDVTGVGAGCPAGDGAGQNASCWTTRLTFDTVAEGTVTIEATRRINSLNPESALPRARFSYTPLRAERGVPVSFSAATSWDPLNQPMSYEWDWGDGTSKPSSSDPTATHTFSSYPPAGMGFPYTVTLTVTTASGSASQSAAIAVMPQRPSASDIGFTAPVIRGTSVVYSSTIGAGDATGLQCLWDWGDGTTIGPMACNAGVLSQTKSYSTVGPRLIQLTVTGSSGTATSRAVVNVTNAAPVVTAITTTPGLIRRMSNMGLSATAVSTGGTIQRIVIDWGDGSAPTTKNCNTGATCSFSNELHSYASRGNKTITLIAYDDFNEASVAATRVIFVAAKAPTAVFTTNPDASPGNPVNASANIAADPADEQADVATYTWTLTSYPDGTSTVSSSSEAPVFTSLHAGNYFLYLTVKGHDDATPVTTAKRLLIWGAPTKPGMPWKVGQGCCDTWGDFSFAAVPGADEYEVHMDGVLGCLSNHSDITSFTTPASGGVYTAQVRAVGLCLGSKYKVKVRARVYGGDWGAWSDTRTLWL
jgi:prepilin-type N-terminal cleavage/methylation domain-containing protein